MFIEKSIGHIYNLPISKSTPESRLEYWYVELINKRIEDISLNDVIRMLQQEIVIDLAVRKAIVYLRKDPLAGEMYDGQLMEVLSSLGFEAYRESIEELRSLVTEKSLRNWMI